MEKPPMEQSYAQNPAYPQLPSYTQDPNIDKPPPYSANFGKEQQYGNEGGQGPPAFEVPPQQVNPTVVQVVQLMNLGSRSTRMHCPHCGADVETRVKFNPGRMTHLAAIILCLLCWPCVCVPYCIDDCMDADHDCPNCDRHIGTYRR